MGGAVSALGIPTATGYTGGIATPTDLTKMKTLWNCIKTHYGLAFIVVLIICDAIGMLLAILLPALKRVLTE
jgi:hypothetical protein